MSLSDISDRDAVLKAIEEFNDLGRSNFLEKYGFSEAKEFFLRFRGQSYDSKAICGAAHGYQFPEMGPLKAQDFSGGKETVKKTLNGLNFRVGYRPPESEEELLKILNSLQSYKQKGKIGPHRPLLFLWAVKRFSDFGTSMITLNELEDELPELSDNFSNYGLQNVSEPFWRSQRDGTWEVLDGDEYLMDSIPFNNTPNRTVLKGTNVIGQLSPQIETLISSDPDLTEKIFSALIVNFEDQYQSSVEEWFFADASQDSSGIRSYDRRPRAWVIRPGNKDVRKEMSQHCLNNDIACIGWRLGAIDPEISFDELRDLIDQTYAHEPKGARRNYLGQIWPFIEKIQPGDFIISPNYATSFKGKWTDNGSVMIGVCTKSYHQSPDGSRDGDSMRVGVDWKLTEYEVSLLGSGITRYLRRPSTVSWLDDNVSERIESLLNNGTTKRHWWVNQNSSWDEESSFRIVTAPTAGKKNQKIQHHLNVGRIYEGDIILHYRKGEIVAVSEALSNASVRQRPYSGKDERWSKEVNLVDCWYDILNDPIKKENISLRMEGKEPFTKDGAVRQGYMFPLEQIFIDRFVEDHGEFLNGTPLRPGNTFIFQGNPDLWDFDSYLDTAKPGDVDNWKVSQHKNQMSAGDRVLFWKSGEEAGIYATGKLIGEIFVRKPDQRLNTDDENELGINYHYLGTLEQPLLKSNLLEHPILKNLGIIKFANATNFKVEESEWKAIRELLTKEEIYQADAPKESTGGSVLSLGEDLLFDPTNFFVEVEELLEDRPQAIFYGPPGTGKTWAALQLAEVLAGDESRTKLVQFHPSYAYEDFIEGWRPTEDGSFKITDGPLKRMAADAAANPNDTFVLVIDEINRANLSKVLGELFFLLEYRDRFITLQYSDTNFKLPENLKIIGTMNTADRSIALVDAALRRRFHFHGFFPDRKPIQGLLRRWLDAQGKTDLLWVADLIDAANNKLDERDLAIGPSHFIKDDLDEDKVQKIWKRSIMPYIEDHYFDDPDQATEFTYDQLRNN